MPLFTDNILEARVAYSALEARAETAERRRAELQAAADKLRAVAAAATEIPLLRQRILDLEAQNLKLRDQIEELGKAKVDLSLQNFVEAVAMAAAVGEASMGNRVVGSISATAHTYIAPSPDGVGLRFQQPEFGGLPSGLSATRFELSKVPPAPGVPAPRSLYFVLEEKQKIYTHPFWERFPPAAQLIAELAKTLANTGRWNFGYLLSSATRVAQQEKSLVASLIGLASPAPLTSYEAAVDRLLALTAVLTSKSRPVSGDLLAVSSALDATTTAAMLFLS